MSRVIVSLILILAGGHANAESTIYLVRHAEKAAGSDPGLTPAGQQRAEWLADYFEGNEVRVVYTTPYRRTRETAQPTAQLLGLEPVEYDPRDLQAFAKQLIENGETSVVAGHSNTTPALVNALLGQERFYPLQDFQYDFIFRVTLHDENPPTVDIDFSEPRSEYPTAPHHSM